MKWIIRILEIIAEVLKAWFSKDSEVIKNEREIRKENNEYRDNINHDINISHDAINFGNDDKLNEILK